MKSVKFGNKNALEIIDTDFKKTIKELLWERAKVRPLDKNYRILDHHTLDHLKKYPHLVALSTYGKKFLLCLIKIDDKNQTIFIDRKGEMMIYMPMGFDETLYKGTIFDGEFIKDNEGKWHYFIMDIVLSDGKPTYLMSMNDKITLVKNIITNKFVAKEMDVCRFEMKEYFTYQYLEDLCSKYVAGLNYKCSGLIFKNQIKNEKGLLYIFPENRTTDSSNPNTNANSNANTNNNTGNNSATNSNSNETTFVNNESFASNNRIFTMKATELPDVYELYGKNKAGNEIKIGLASVTSMEVSKKINKMFQDNAKEAIVECKYIKRFKKWEPVGCVSKEISIID